MKPQKVESVYAGKLFDVVIETWDGREREIVEHSGSVTIVAVDRDARIVLVRQFREAARKALLELPAGIVDDGEQPLETARRELREETGLHGGRWRELRRIHPSPGFVREPVTIFLAEELDEGEPEPDEGEDVELVRLTVREVEDVLGELEDAKTLVGLLLYLRERAEA
jgi:ADP-ribose pyrophosphatase